MFGKPQLLERAWRRDEALCPTQAKTVNGKNRKVSTKGSGVMSKGVIHVVDTVILSPNN